MISDDFTDDFTKATHCVLCFLSVLSLTQYVMSPSTFRISVGKKTCVTIFNTFVLIV